MNKFVAGTMYWYGNADRIFVLHGLQSPSYSFPVDTVACTTTRSANTDTLWISVSVAIAGRDPIMQTKALGDLQEGFTFPDMPLTNISVADDEKVVFAYVVINNGHSTEGEVHKLIENPATKIAATGADAAANIIGDAAKTAGGAVIGALFGLVVPIVGTIVGAALGASSTITLAKLVDILNLNYDGPIGSGAMTIGGAELRRMPSSSQPWTRKDHNPGPDSPGGYGRNPDYSTTLSISRA